MGSAPPDDPNDTRSAGLAGSTATRSCPLRKAIQPCTSSNMDGCTTLGDVGSSTSVSVGEATGRSVVVVDAGTANVGASEVEALSTRADWTDSDDEQDAIINSGITAANSGFRIMVGPFQDGRGWGQASRSRLLGRTARDRGRSSCATWKWRRSSPGRCGSSRARQRLRRHVRGLPGVGPRFDDDERAVEVEHPRRSSVLARCVDRLPSNSCNRRGSRRGRLGAARWNALPA